MALSTIFNRVQEIATPSRSPVRGINEFINKAIGCHTTQPVFANVYENTDNTVKFNKGFFDFDHKDKRVVEQDVQQTADNLIKRGAKEKELLRVWTTGKGEHLYNKMTTISINKQEKDEEGIKIFDKWRRMLKGFQQAMTKGMRSIDTKPFGDLSRVARVPGIQRPDTRGIPIVIDLRAPLDEWLVEHRSWGARIEAGNEVLDAWGSGTVNFNKLVKEDDYKNVTVYNSAELPDLIDIEVDMIEHSYGGQYQEEIRPMLREIGFGENYITSNIFDRNADNNTRVHVGTRFLEKGYGLVLATNMLALCGWDNFNYGFTYGKLNDIVGWKR